MFIENPKNLYRLSGVNNITKFTIKEKHKTSYN